MTRPPAPPTMADGQHQRRLLIKAGYVLTMNDQLGDLPTGDTLIEGSRIIDVAPSIPLDATGHGEVIDASGMFVTPGLIDNHRHLWQSLIRGRSATFGEYFAHALEDLSGRFTPEDIYLGNLLSAYAASLGLADQIGTLTPGKQADLALYDASDLNLFLAEPTAGLVQAAHPGNVHTVLVAGHVVKRDKQMVGLDLEHLRGKARHANHRLLRDGGRSSSGFRRRRLRAAKTGSGAAPGGRGGRSGVVAAAAAVMTLAGLAGCTSNGTEPSDPARGSPPLQASTPAGDPVVEAEQAALGVYRGMWQAYTEAGGPPEADPDDPGLGAHAAGDALLVLVDGVTALRDQGLVTAGEVVLNPVVVELSPENLPARARIEDCADTSGSSRVRADGEPFEDEPGGRRLVIATVVVTSGGAWKVVDFAVRSVGSC